MLLTFCIIIPLATEPQPNGVGQFGHWVQVDGEPLEAPKPLSWYPDKLGWHMAFSRAQLRKLPILKQVHELIIRENDAGAITRQEAVSMIPPLLLDVQPHHRVRHHSQGLYYNVAVSVSTI